MPPHTHTHTPTPYLHHFLPLGLFFFTYILRPLSNGNNNKCQKARNNSLLGKVAIDALYPHGYTMSYDWNHQKNDVRYYAFKQDFPDTTENQRGKANLLSTCVGTRSWMIQSVNLHQIYIIHTCISQHHNYVTSRSRNYVTRKCQKWKKKEWWIRTKI